MFHCDTCKFAMYKRVDFPSSNRKLFPLHYHIGDPLVFLTCLGLVGLSYLLTIALECHGHFS